MTNILLHTASRLTALAAIAALTACAAPAREDAGEADDALPTFVSLNPCLDDLLVNLADQEQVLALSHYSRDPASSSLGTDKAKHYGVTGGTVEEVLALEPDVVLASTFIDTATKAALDRMNVRVETFNSPNSVKESLDQIRRLATVTGHEGKGRDLIARIEQSLAAPVSGDWISAMIWQSGQIVPGETTLVRDLMRRTGFSSHSETRGLGQGDYVSLEGLLADPPDLLLIAGESAGQTHPLLDQLDETRTTRFEPRLFYCGGPSIIAARERLVEIRESLK